MDTKILALSGKKQSGKSAAANEILGIFMSSLGIIRGYTVDGRGDLYVTDIFGDEELRGRFDYYRDNDMVRGFLEEYVHPYVKLYSFADQLKEFCVNILGVNRERVYGNNEEKDGLTHLMWEDMPGIVSPDNYEVLAKQDIERLTGCLVRSGPMSGRDVMQYFGSDVVRKIYPPAWAKSTVNRIKREGTLLAVITDCRFLDEVQEVQNNGGHVIRLTRGDFNDEHYSETNLDDFLGFDASIDNSKINIEQTNDILKDILNDWGWIPAVEVMGENKEKVNAKY